MNWIELYAMIEVIGGIIGLLILIGIIIYMIVTKRKPF